MFFFRPNSNPPSADATSQEIQAEAASGRLFSYPGDQLDNSLFDDEEKNDYFTTIRLGANV